VIFVSASAQHQGYPLDRAIAYLEAMDALATDPSPAEAKIAKIDAALRLLGRPMPAPGGVTVVATLPVPRRTLADIFRDVYRPGARWGNGRPGRA